MATTRSIASRVITFASTDPEADRKRLSRHCRLGFGWVVVEPRPGGRPVVSARVRAGSVAERYALRRAEARSNP
jgi:hypothetical protein